MADWWKKGEAITLWDTNFQKIVNFYLFNCPCETESGSVAKKTKTYTKVSKRGTTLRAQGWSKGSLKTLLAAMKKTVSGHLEYHPFSGSVDIAIETSKIERGVDLSDTHFEMIVFAERSDMSMTSAIFYYVRNAFAHGSFSVIVDNGRKIYYLESSKNSTVKARIRLNEETLLKWIKEFSLSPNSTKNVNRQETKSRRKKMDGAA